MTPDDEAAAAFARDGVACVRSVLDPGEVAAAAAAIDAVLARPGPLAQVASAPGDPGAFTEDFCRWREIAQIERLARHSRVPAVAAALMATPQVRFYHDHVLVKEGGTRQRTPWHQDQPYYNVDGFQTCSSWMPVDPVDRESTVEFVAGSHRGPWLMPRTFMDDQAKWFPEGTLEELPDIEGKRDDFEILAWELEPGDVVFFHMLTLHAAGGATQRRRAFSVRFLGDDATHAPRAWRTSPDFPGLADDLPAGAPMDHELFPMLWP
jgi:ectoine hydroxylase-related dioxygenase (phytanoyl-CoA dioxygenase family)